MFNFFAEKINNKVNVTFDIVVRKSTEEIVSHFKEKANVYKWYYVFVPGKDDIDYSEFAFSGKQIEVSRTPQPFWPFRAFGKIKMTLAEKSSTETIVRCHITPWNNAIPMLAVLHVAVIGGWGILWIVFARKQNLLIQFGVPVGVLIISAAFQALKIIIDCSNLTRYAESIIDEIKK